MLTHIFERAGTGAVASVDLPFDPTAALIVPMGAAIPVWHAEGMWCARSTPFGADDSVNGGVRFFGRKMVFGVGADCNASGTFYRVLVLGAENGDVDSVAWCGNATAGRTVPLNMSATPVAALIKRDSTRPTVIKAGSYAGVCSDGTAVTDPVTLNAGYLTLTADVNVNEWTPASDLGEGIHALAFSSDAAVIGTYTGNGSAQAVNVGCDAAAVIAWGDAGSGVAHVFMRGSMGGQSKQTSATAPSAVGTLQFGRLTLSSSTMNANGTVYRYIALKHKTASLRQSVKTPVRNRAAIYLPGRSLSSYIDCGTGLNIDGPMSIVWTGQVHGDGPQGGLFVSHLLAKAATGQADVAGGASWGLMAVSRIDGGWQWPGPHLSAVTTSRIFFGSPIDHCCWRTGVLAPFGVHQYGLVCIGNGEWQLWLDGKIVKHRKLSTDTAASNATHKVGIGARWSGSAWVNSARMLFAGASVYSRALSPDEMRTMYARDMLGSTSDVTSGLAERWDASTASDTVLPAQVSGANSGVITLGQRIVLP